MVCFVIDSEPSDSGVIMVMMSLMMRMMMMRKRGMIRMRRRRMAKVCEGEQRADW